MLELEEFKGPKEELKKYFQEAVRIYDDKLSNLEKYMRSKDFWIGISRNDSILLYMMVRYFKPRIIMEGGCSHGWASQWIARALRANEKGHLYAFEIQSSYIEQAKELLKDFKDIIDFIEGDVTPSLSCAFGLVGGSENYAAMPSSKKNTMMKTLAKIGYIDFLVMDCYNNYQFGKWWTTSIVPYVSKGGIIAIHDIVYKDGEIIVDLSVGDESVAVKELLKYRQKLKPIKTYEEVLPNGYTDGIGMIYLRENII